MASSSTAFPLQMSGLGGGQGGHWLDRHARPRRRRLRSLGGQLLMRARAWAPRPSATCHADRSPAASTPPAWRPSRRPCPRGRPGAAPHPRDRRSRPGGRWRTTIMLAAGWRRTAALQLTSTQVIDLSRELKPALVGRLQASPPLRQRRSPSAAAVHRRGSTPKTCRFLRHPRRDGRAQWLHPARLRGLPRRLLRPSRGRVRHTCSSATAGRHGGLQRAGPGEWRSCLAAYGGFTDAGAEARAGHFFEWEAIIRCKARVRRCSTWCGRSTRRHRHFEQGFGVFVVEIPGSAPRPHRQPRRHTPIGTLVAASCGWPVVAWAAHDAVRAGRPPGRTRTAT